MNGVQITNLPWSQGNPSGGVDCLAINYREGYDDDTCGEARRYICETGKFHSVTCTFDSSKYLSL